MHGGDSFGPRKAAFVVGAGSYGRGAMVCRTGPNFMGHWGAPAMYALERRELRIATRRPSHRFRSADYERAGSKQPPSQQGETGSGCFSGRRTRWPGRCSKPKSRRVCMPGRKFLPTRVRAGLFAGVSLEGSTLRPDDDANEALYGRKIGATAILLGPGSPKTPLAGGSY